MRDFIEVTLAEENKTKVLINVNSIVSVIPVKDDPTGGNVVLLFLSNSSEAVMEDYLDVKMKIDDAKS